MKEPVSFEHINQITLGDPLATKDLLEVFVRQNLRNIEDIKEDLARERWSEMRKVAHKLKSSLALVGMTAHRALAEELEENAGIDPGRTRELVVTLTKATHRALDEIRQKLKTL